MTDKKLQQELANIPDKELIELATQEIHALCRTGGKSFTMTVPVRAKDSDMILIEVLNRYKQLLILQ